MNDYFLKKLDGDADETPADKIREITTKDAKLILENPKAYDIDVPSLRHSVESLERTIMVSPGSKRKYGTFFPGSDDSQPLTPEERNKATEEAKLNPAFGYS